LGKNSQTVKILVSWRPWIEEWPRSLIKDDSAVQAFPKHLLLAAIAASLASAAGAAVAAPQYTITAIGGEGCAPEAINDSSIISGTCDGTAVVWKNGVATSLGRLVGGTYSEAKSANAQGVVAGDGDTGNSRPQGWVSTPTGLYNFFSNNGGNTHVLFIGDNGFIGGYYTKSLSGNTSSWKGSIWTPDSKVRYRQLDLPVLPGGVNPKASSSVPAAFNQLGQAAGYATNDVIGQHAAFWNNDGAHSVIDLGVLPGGWTSIAWGMNNLGQVVGESHPGAGSRAVLWNNDPAHTATELLPLPGDNYGVAQEINDAGQVLGFSAYATPGTWNVGPSRYVVWADGVAYDLNTVLDPVTGAGWTVTSAMALNNLGQIVGTGTLNGQLKAFVMTPK
jgi:uncharacterized membrane protein